MTTTDDRVRQPDTVNGTPKRIGVLLTSFNRCAVTLKCLEKLFEQEHPGLELEVFLVDDASSDGTVEAVTNRFPQVHLERGSGDLYWNRGMYKAFENALQHRFDYYLWLNDDTILHEGAIGLLIVTAEALERQGVPAIVTGSTRDSRTEAVTYGGIEWRSRWLPPMFRRVNPDPEVPVLCATMNGNCTLIPHAITNAIGNLDSHFQHNFGDLDYGLRATEAGFAVYLAPGYIGDCSENPNAGTWMDTSLPLRLRWKLMQSPKGSPWREWSYFAKRHMGPLWLLYAVSPYVRLILSAARET